MASPRYLPDPEEQMQNMGSFDSEPVEAENRDEAEQECQELADSYGVELVDVEQRDSNWWDCIFGELGE